MMVKNSISFEKFFGIAVSMVLAVLLIYLPLDSGGVYVRAQAVLGIFVFFLLGLVVLVSREKFPVDLKWAAGIFAGLLLLSAFFSTDRFLSLTSTVFVLTGLGGFILGNFLIGRGKMASVFLHFLAGLLFFNSVSAIGSYYTVYFFAHRAYGFFYQPNVMAGYILLLVFSVVCVFLSGRGRYNFLYGFLSIIALTALVLTRSRGAYIAFAAVAPLVIFLCRRWLSWRRLLAGLAILLVGTYILSGLVIYTGSFVAPQRGADISPAQEIENSSPSLQSKDSESVGARLSLWSAALKIARQFPFLGAGLDTFRYHYSRYQTRIKFYSKDVHNYYLSLVAELGFPALLAFFVLLFVLGRHIIFSLKNLAGGGEGGASDILQPGYTGLALGLAAVLLHIFVDVDFGFGAVYFTFWCCCGFLFGLRPKESVERISLGNLSLLRVGAAVLVMLPAVIPVLSYFSGEMLRQGQILQQNCYSRAAEAKFLRAYKIAPFSSDAAQSLSSCYYVGGDLPRSLAWSRRAVQLSPWRAKLYSLQGKVLFDMGRGVESESLYEKALELDPMGQLTAYNYLAELYISWRQPEKALAVYKRLDKIYRGLDLNDLWGFRLDSIKTPMATAYLNMGVLYRDGGDYALAVDAFGESMRYFRSPYTMKEIGDTFFMEKDWGRALASYGAALGDSQFNRVDSDIYLKISLCYKNMGDSAEAEKFYNEYLKCKKEKDPSTKPQ